jgi:hypothetical protein
MSQGSWYLTPGLDGCDGWFEIKEKMEKKINAMG